MPELPEVETMCRGIAAAVGSRIAAARFPRGRVRPLAIDPRPATFVPRIVGRSITAVQRRGKRVVLEVVGSTAAEPLWLAIEPRMTGLMLIVDPPSEDHVRLVLDLERPDGRRARPARIVFWDRRGLGTIRLHDRPGLEAVCGPDRLGPDGLVVTGGQLAARLGRSRRAIKAALLDQRAVAGIGNIYAAEILFRLGIDPRTPCRRLTASLWGRLATAAREVLTEAIQLEGSSIGDETYRTADNRAGRFQSRHAVYGRAGQPCRSCGGPVSRLVLAQRATFFCGACQRRPGSRPANRVANGGRMT